MTDYRFVDLHGEETASTVWMGSNIVRQDRVGAGAGQVCCHGGFCHGGPFLGRGSCTPALQVPKDQTPLGHCQCHIGAWPAPHLAEGAHRREGKGNVPPHDGATQAVGGMSLSLRTALLTPPTSDNWCRASAEIRGKGQHSLKAFQAFSP